MKVLVALLAAGAYAWCGEPTTEACRCPSAVIDALCDAAPTFAKPEAEVRDDECFDVVLVCAGGARWAVRPRSCEP